MEIYSAISQEILHENQALLLLPAGSEKLKDALMEEDLNGRQPQWKMTLDGRLV